jgi:dUTP pyrophosphatase
MNVKFKLHHEGAVLPCKQTAGAIGYDLVVPEDTIIYGKRRQVIRLGFAMELPKNVEAKIEPRSGFSSNGIEGYPATVDNGFTYVELRSRRIFGAEVLVGKIDPDYRGEVGVIIKNDDCSFKIEKGTRIAQMTFYQIPEVTLEVCDKLSETERGDGGYGHTGTSYEVQEEG